MRIATYNVNGINGRLANLLGWLQEAAPDIVCLQELKAPDDKFPAAALRGAGYGAVWHGQKSWNGVAILARGAEPVETRRGLPGDPDDMHSRYIEAAIGGIVRPGKSPISNRPRLAVRAVGAQGLPAGARCSSCDPSATAYRKSPGACAIGGLGGAHRDFAWKMLFSASPHPMACRSAGSPPTGKSSPAGRLNPPGS